MTILLPLLLLAAPQPAVSVTHADLALAQAADRAELRARVTVAVKDVCHATADDVVPAAFRHDKFYCFERVRNAVVADMPRDVRAAYKAALREAGIRGRRL